MGSRSRRQAPGRGETLLAIGLASGRLAIGGGLWIAPHVALGALGFADAGPRAVLLARIAGTRDVVLGAWQLAAAAGRGRLGSAATAGAAADAADVLAFALALAAPQTRSAAIRGLAGAAPAAAAGAWLAARLR